MFTFGRNRCSTSPEYAYGPKLIAFEEKSPLEDRMLRLRYEFDGTYEIRIRDDSKKSKDPLGEILGVPCNVQVSGEKVKQ